MIALVRGHDLLAPQPGYFVARVALGDVVHPGSVLGTLEILGTVRELVAPEATGTIVALVDPKRARVPVDYGALIATLDPSVGRAAALTTTESPMLEHGGTPLFRAPTSGRFYGRSSPDKPPFVSAGDRLVPGATICLLEVMKTFHRVTYGGEPVTVRTVLVTDGADVNQGDPLLALDS